MTVLYFIKYIIRRSGCASNRVRWKQKRGDLSPLLEELFRTVVSLGGMISGEHGIGLAKKRYLPLSLDSYQIELMKRIKRTFDPNNILNPGKIF